jgi:hypothetical protein
MSWSSIGIEGFFDGDALVLSGLSGESELVLALFCSRLVIRQKITLGHAFEATARPTYFGKPNESNSAGFMMA